MEVTTLGGNIFLNQIYLTVFRETETKTERKTLREAGRERDCVRERELQMKQSHDH